LVADTLDWGELGDALELALELTLELSPTAPLPLLDCCTPSDTPRVAHMDRFTVAG
jgi:hypothetical protein